MLLESYASGLEHSHEGEGIRRAGRLRRYMTRGVSARAPCGARPRGASAWARKRCAP